MRTTLDIDTDILQAVKELSRQKHSSAGAVLSDLARSALSQGGSEGAGLELKHGVPVFPARPGEVITLEHVLTLEEDGF